MQFTCALWVVLFLVVPYARNKPLSKNLVHSTSCMVVDNIRQHNSQKLWWWSKNLERPQILNRPKQRFSRFSKEWLVFTSFHRVSGKAVMEFAHTLKNGKCRFLVYKLRKQILGFTPPMKCKAGLNGERGFFISTSGAQTGRRVQISSGSRHVSEGKKKFVGVKNNLLVLTALTGKNMAWWEPVFVNFKQCPQQVLQNI